MLIILLKLQAYFIQVPQKIVTVS